MRKKKKQVYRYWSKSPWYLKYVKDLNFCKWEYEFYGNNQAGLWIDPETKRRLSTEDAVKLLLERRGINVDEARAKG